MARLARARAFKVLPFPVVRTGVYLNAQLGEYEYWFFNEENGRSAKIGGCKKNMPTSVIMEWREHTTRELAKKLAEHAAGIVRRK